jgi:hypothetical protein
MIELTHNDFAIASDEDEIRVDGLCRELLRNFHHSLLQRGTQPLEAGFLAHGADYFLRDFVVAARRMNLLDGTPGIVRRFAATWYIISTLEPDWEELAGHLEGIRELYRFLHAEKLISTSCLEEAERECADRHYYEKRISSFRDITGDGYYAWERECTLKS